MPSWAGMSEADLKFLGKSGVRVPGIGLGTWGIGGYGKRDTRRDIEAIEAVQRAVELGMWLVDTAEVYGAGHSEELVGEAIKAFRRERVFIISKVLDTHLRRKELIEACRGSLRRLGTGFIDLYLIHFPNYSVPLRETMQAMEELVENGLVRFIGVSNFPLNLMIEAQSHLRKAEIQANEVKYNVKTRYIEDDLLPHCQREGVSIIAYTPLEEGSLANSRSLWEIGGKYGKTAAQLALNWLICKGNVVAIPKAINKRHLEENSGAMGWRIDQEDMGRISKAFA